jgi:Tol biopolymer transport system component
LKKSKKEIAFQQVKLSPDGNYIAYVTNDWGRKKIWLFNQSSGKQKAIFKAEPKFEQKTDIHTRLLAGTPAAES